MADGTQTLTPPTPQQVLSQGQSARASMAPFNQFPTPEDINRMMPASSAPAPPPAQGPMLPAGTGDTFPMVFDDGSRAMVPSAKVSDAFKSGGKLAQPMTFPDGSRSMVAFDKVHDATAQGGQFMPVSAFQNSLLPKPQPPQMQEMMGLTSGPEAPAATQLLNPGEIIRALGQAASPWLQRHAQQQRQEAQRETYMAAGPESENVSLPARAGYALLSPAHEAEAALSDVVRGTTTDPNAQAAMAAGMIDPAIPLVYFSGQGLGGLTGIGTGRPSSVAQAYQNPTPDNVQHALFDAAQAIGPVEGLRAPVVEGFEGGGALPETPGAVNRPIDTGYGSSVGMAGRGISTALGPVVDRLRSIYDPAELSAAEAAMKAFRPRNSKVNWQDDITRALPLMRRSADSLGINIDDMTPDEARQATDDAARESWAEYKRNHLGPNADVTVNTQPVADAMRNEITNTMREQDPAQAREIERLASTFDNREMTIQEVQQRVSELNNQTRGIEGRYLGDKRAAKLDPNNAYIFAQRDTLRSLMDDQINQLSGPGAADLRRNYGALRSVEDVIQRRQNVVDRAAREPLSAMLAKAYATAHIVGGILGGHPLGALQGIATLAAERRARALQDPNYLTQLAFGKTTPAAPWSPTTPEGPRAPTTAEQVGARAAQLAGAQQQAIAFPEGPLFGIQQTVAPQRTGPFEMPAAAIPQQQALPPGPEQRALPAGPPAPGPPAQLPAPGETAPAQPGPTGPFPMPDSPLGPVMQQRQFQIGRGAEPPITTPSRMLPPATLPERNIAPIPGFEAPTAPSASAEQAALERATAQGRGPYAEPTAAEGYGSQNKIVTQQEYEQAKQDLTRDLMGGMKAGVPLTPENLARATKIGMYHLEAGARSFAAWSKAMLAELGEGIQPHLQGIWDRIQAGVIVPKTEATEPPPEAPSSQPTLQSFDAEGNLRRKLNRKEGLGAPEQDKAIELTREDGKPFYVGRMTPAQWMDKVTSYLSPEEITKWRAWYRDVHQHFLDDAGGNEEEASKNERAWLLTQTNTSPAGGFMNLQRAKDILSGQPQVKIPGLGSQRVYAALRGEMPSSGVGAKLSDFVDSAGGKDTRTWMGDDPRGGSPAVVDVHGARDAGFIDEALHNVIKEQFGPKVARRIAIDMGDGPSDTQYENGSDWYNDLVNKLNKRGFDGGKWRTEEAQAVGWAAQQLMTGRTPQLVEDIFPPSRHTISSELAFGEGSPYAKEFPDLSKLPYEQSKAITDQVANKVMEVAGPLVGGRVIQHLSGPGKWQEYPVTPSVQTVLQGSPEAAQRLANTVGYLMQQTQVLASRPLKSGNKGAFQILDTGASDALRDPAKLQAFWNDFRDTVQRTSPRLAAKLTGFMPIEVNGQPGIRALMERGRWEDENDPQLKQLDAAANEASERANIETETSGYNAATETAQHDWKKDPTGRQYLQRLGEIGRPDLQGRLASASAEIRDEIRRAFDTHAPGAYTAPNQETVSSSASPVLPFMRAGRPKLGK